MKIFVRVKTHAKIDLVQKVDEQYYRVSVKAFPEDGKANQSVLKLLAEFFTVPIDRVRLLSGQKAHIKLIYINTELSTDIPPVARA